MPKVWDFKHVKIQRKYSLNNIPESSVTLSVSCAFKWCKSVSNSLNLLPFFKSESILSCSMLTWQTENKLRKDRHSKACCCRSWWKKLFLTCKHVVLSCNWPIMTMDSINFAGDIRSHCLLHLPSFPCSSHWFSSCSQQKQRKQYFWINYFSGRVTYFICPNAINSKAVHKKSPSKEGENLEFAIFLRLFIVSCEQFYLKTSAIS